MVNDSLDIPRLAQVADEATDAARGVLLGYFGRLTQVEEKPKEGLVSEADKEAEETLIKIFQKHFPEFGVLGEESGLTSGADGSEGRWIIDPLDGTTNFVFGFPVYCISIAFEWKGEIVFGLVDVPPLDRRYTAIKGQGAKKNGQIISVSKRADVKEALAATGFAVSDKEAVQAQVQRLDQVLSVTRGIRRVGSAAFDLCMVAEGVFDFYWENNLKPWDIAAGGLIAAEAGGKVTSTANTAYDHMSGDVLASNSLLHDQAYSLLLPKPSNP